LASYAERDQTRREHAVEVMREYGFTVFGIKEYRRLSAWLTEQACGADIRVYLITWIITPVKMIEPSASASNRSHPRASISCKAKGCIS
jgi:hypothetical protein